MDSDDDDDDDEDLNALLADVSAEASSLSRWCSGMQVADDGNRTLNDAHIPVVDSDVPCPASHARQTQFRPVDLLVESGVRLRPADLCPDPVPTTPPAQVLDVPLPMHDPIARRGPTCESSVPLKSEPSLLDLLSGGVGPFRVMAWGTALVIAITLLAYVTTATRTSGASELPALEKSLERAFPEALSLDADASRLRLARPRGTSSEVDETARARVASLLAGEDLGVGRAVVVHGAGRDAPVEVGSGTGRIAAHGAT